MWHIPLAENTGCRGFRIVLLFTLAFIVVLTGCGTGGGVGPSRTTVGQVTNHLFVANNAADNVSVFGIDSISGALVSTGSIADTVGSKPRFVAVDPLSHFLYVANAGNGTVSAFSIDRSTGAATAVPGSPFATGSTTPIEVQVAPQAQVVFVANQASENVSVLTVSTAGALSSIAGSPFTVTGVPQALAVHPSGRLLYVATSTGIVGFLFASTGTPIPISSGLPLAGVSASSMTITPSGAFLYVTVPSNNTVVAFAVESATGVLTQVGTGFPVGSQPSSIALDPSGSFLYVANTASNNLSAYQVNSSTGALTTISGSPFVAGSGPVSVVVEPSGKFVYVANNLSNNISTFTLTATSGVLTPVGTSLTPTGAGPVSLATTHQ